MFPKDINISFKFVLVLFFLFFHSNFALAEQNQRQILRSASEYDYPPFAIVRPDGTADGFSVEVLKAVAQAAHLEVNFSVGPWHEIKQQLAEGRLDVLPLVAYSTDRDTVYDFTVPYLHMHGTIFVRKGERSIQAEEDLKEKEVVVMRGDSAQEYAVRKNLSEHLFLTTTLEEAMQRLSSGLHDAVLCQELVGLQLIRKLGIQNVVRVSTEGQTSLKPRTMRISGFNQKFCIAVPEGKKDLLSHLNEGLALIIANGTYDQLYEKWFGPIIPEPAFPWSKVIKFVLLMLLPILFLIACFGVWYLRRQVRNKTNSLNEKIQELTLVETELRKEEATRRRAQEAGKIGSWWYDPATQQPRWTDEMFHVFGMAPGKEVPSYNEHKKIIHPEDWDRFDAAVHLAVTKGIGYALDLRVTDPNGEIGWVNSICKPVKNDQGLVTELIGTTQNITNRKNIEIKQAYLQKRLEAIWKLSSLHNADLTIICDNVLDEIVAMTGSYYGFYGFLNDTEDTMTVLSWSKFAMKECAMHGKPLVFAIENSGIWGNAVRTREPFTLNDYQASCENKTGLPEGHVALTRFLSVPVELSGKIVAVGAVANKKEPYDEDDVQQLTSFLANVQIIMNQKGSEEKLRVSERVLKKTQEIAHLGSWQFNIKENLLTWSDEEYRIFGRSPQDFGGTYEDFLETIHPEDREMADRVYTLALQNHTPYECSFRIIRPDGEVRFVHEKAENMSDENGKTTHSIGFTQDITELKNAENALMESEKKYRNLLDSTSTVAWELDLGSGKFTFMGKQIEAILGYPVDSWVDMNTWVERLHPEDRAETVLFCKLQTEKGNDHDFTYRALHLDGSYKWIRDIVTVVDGKEGPVKLVGFMYDITEQKNVALEKERLEEQWRQTQKLEAIGTLAGGIAHDFNNILGVIIGYTDMAKEDAPSGSKFSKDLDRVLKAANRAKNLVRQILAFSRQSQTERIVLRPQPIIKEAMKMLRSSIPTTIEIQENISQDCGNVLADATQLYQILMNLCTNAFHAMEVKGGTLKVDLRRADAIPVDLKDKKLRYLDLSVSDTGHGISPEIIERIFDPFFTTKEMGKGTGMGLSIIYGIVKEYGGSITVDSQPEKGTTFHVYLPVIEQMAVPEDETEEKIPGGKEMILFVDDEELLAEMGKDMLQRLGYQVTIKMRSIEALEAFQNEPDKFDLVITDHTMPGMTGLDLSRRMLQIRPDLPIILCTGYSNLVSEEVAKAQGIKEFALKPVSKGTIAGVIRKVLDSR